MINMIEKEVLGCFLKDNTLLNETQIRPSYFEKQAHQLIYQSMLTLIAEGKKVDKVTLLSDNYQYIQQLIGPAFITDLETNGDVDNFETYERELIEKYQKRRSEQIVKQWLSKKNRDNQALITELQKLEDLIHEVEPDKNETLQQMYELPYLENNEVGIPSGLSDLDNLTGGFQKHNSYILGARPSMGKTATMLKFALSASKNGAIPLIFSLEMSKESLLRRFIASLGKINSFLTRTPHRLTNSKKEHWKLAIEELYKLNFEIYDKPLQEIQYIRSQVRKAKRKHEGKQIFVLIDYLTLIHSNKDYYSDHAKFTDISNQLKAIAKEYDCPVLTLAQLSRGVEQRNDKRPMLSDLRESGSIEQDADMVMFLYRDSYYNKD